MKYGVFIHTNHRQRLGALVSAHSLLRNTRHGEQFEIRILDTAEFAFLKRREGQLFLRGTERRVWRYDDLQSFTPLRFVPPELMGYKGRAVVMDPDVFAVGDIFDLLSRDMDGKAILCRERPDHNGVPEYLASSVMLLDCAKLTHWHCEAQFEEMFEFRRDYVTWVHLGLEPRDTIGLFGEEWNHFDTLNEKTKLLHNTKRRTQPWKTGLPVDYTVRETGRGFLPKRWLKHTANRLLGDASPAARYKPHPDRNQERLFFSLLRECVEKGTVDEAMLVEEMRKGHLRHDALELLNRPPSMAAA